MSRFNKTFRIAAASLALVTLEGAAGLGAQNFDGAEFGGVPIAVVVPTTARFLTEEQKEMLGNKLLNIATSNGMSGMGGASRFELVPVLTVTKESEAGELQKFRVASLAITFAIRQRSQNLTFGSANLTVDGMGPTREAAISDAIDNINGNDARLVTLLETGRRRIVQYYEQNCAQIRSESRARAGTGETAQAVALLMSVPREASECQSAASTEAQQIYKAYAEKECTSLVKSARAEAANRSFSLAIAKLRRVDATSTCGASVDAVIDDIDKKVTQAADRRFQLELDSLRAERSVLKKDFEVPARIESYRKKQIGTLAIEGLGKLSITPHIPST